MINLQSLIPLVPLIDLRIFEISAGNSYLKHQTSRGWQLGPLPLASLGAALGPGTARGHLLDTTVDIVYILVLVKMAWCMEASQTPQTWILVLFAALSLIIAGSLILKLFGGMYLFSANCSAFAVGVLKHVNLWNVIFSLTVSRRSKAMLFLVPFVGIHNLGAVALPESRT
jgi:hypothetical protein